ncbi:SphA family protein [Dyella japonica]|uniref:Transporter n=1 Tax=Dyella japonica A8 TaxID=1217721 RepID=A0A075K2Q0_9GAMM|nr:transporter [Dyella japonica]AIF48494.1 hypothetical protein HY57_15255 [Dyella japonica A8]
MTDGQALRKGRRAGTRAGGILCVCLLAAMAPCVQATEGAGGMYLLGSQSLDAGLSPAPGWYVTVVGVQYSGSVSGTVQGGVVVKELDKRSDSLTALLLYAPQRKVLGGQLALSVGAPYAYVRLSGEVQGPRRLVQRSVSGTGLSDTSLGARLGWRLGPAFSHALALTVWAPTGDYQKGFTPSTGHNRWAGDFTWALTYAPGNHRTEVSAALGYGINSPNTTTRYLSGNELHLELSVGQRLTPHFELGLSGYTYRQVTADSGAGALFGSLKGRVSGAGPALNYSSKLGGYGLILAARYYHEFDAKRHFRGDLALASATLHF